MQPREVKPAVGPKRPGFESALEEVWFQACQGRKDDAFLFALLARLALRIGRQDLQQEFQKRAQVGAEDPLVSFSVSTAAPASVPAPTDKAAGGGDRLLARGIKLLQEGKPAEAETALREALGQEPVPPEVHLHLGVALARQRRLPEAEAAFQMALRHRPGLLLAYMNLATACLEQNRPLEAEGYARQGLHLQPTYAEGHRLVGMALEARDQLEPAEAAFREAVRLQPNLAEAHYQLGRLLRRRNRAKDAEAAFRRAVSLQPDHADAWHNLGNLCEEGGRATEGEKCCREAVRLQPKRVEFHNGLAITLVAQDRLLEAETVCREALKLKPGHTGIINTLGNVLRQQERLEEAAQALRGLIQDHPTHAIGHNNLGLVLLVAGRLQESMIHFDEACRLRPEYAEAHVNRALTLLSNGDFARGWPEYEWRMKMRKVKFPKFAQPRWQHQTLTGRTLLLFAEQGLGDTVHFIRLAPELKELGATVLLDCPVPLVDLLSGCAGVDQIIPRGTKLPPYDYWSPLLSLPGRWGVDERSIPGTVPYLQPDAKRVAYWRQELAGLHGLRVGISWQGSKLHWGDRYRSVPLQRFAELAKVPGVRLISLQKGHGSEQLAAAKATGLEVLDLGSRTSVGFGDTAALMANLDLIIAVDTAVAHVAGAVGVPVWVALPFSADWRWLRDRNDTPWYPSMQMFRQPAVGSWDLVFASLRDALVQRVQAGKA